MDAIKIPLKYPIKITDDGSELISELVISRRPTCADIEDQPANPTMRDTLRFIGKITGQPPSVIKKIDLEDLGEISRVATSFLPSGLLTGASQ